MTGQPRRNWERSWEAPMEGAEGSGPDALFDKFLKHLDTHLIRQHVQEFINKNGHSFEEEISHDEESITLMSTFGGAKHGTQVPVGFWFKDMGASYDFTYKWTTIVNHYAMILEEYIMTKDQIPKDL